MTVSTTQRTVTYNGNGATLIFAVPFPFMVAADLSVLVNGVPQALATNYTVTGGAGLTGTVTFLVAPGSGTGNVIISRTGAVLQPVNFRTQGQFYPQVHETALDRVTMLLQDEIAARGEADAALALALSQGTVGGSATLVTSTGSSVARALGARFAEQVNVLDHGADPTGIADSTSAFNTACTVAAASYRRTVYVPAGAYKISGSGVEVPTGVFIRGAAGATPASGGADLVAASASVTQLLLFNGTDGGASNIYLYGENTRAVVGIRIGLTGSAGRLRFSNVVARKLKWGFHVLNGSFLLAFNDCVGWDCKKGVYLDSTGAATYGGTTVLTRGGNIVTWENGHTVSNTEHGFMAQSANAIQINGSGWDYDATGIRFEASTGAIRHGTSDLTTTASVEMIGNCAATIEDVAVYASQLPFSFQASGGAPQIVIKNSRSLATVGSVSVSATTDAILSFENNTFDKATQNDGERFDHGYRMECGVSTITASGTPASLTQAITFSRAFSALKAVMILPAYNYTNQLHTVHSSASASGFTANITRKDGETWSNGQTQDFYWIAFGT